jgi:hypothetical protein
MLVRDKHSSLLDPFVSNANNEVFYSIGHRIDKELVLSMFEYHNPLDNKDILVKKKYFFSHCHPTLGSTLRPNSLNL